MTKTDHIAALLLDDVLTTVKVRFQSSGYDKIYTYKCLKTLAATLAVGDRVLVDSAYQGKDQISVAVVLSIDPEMDIDLELDADYKYLFAKVDESELSRLKEREVKIVEKINEGRKRAIREKMLQDIGVSRELLLELKPEPKVEICEPDFSNPALQALIREKNL